MNNKYIAKSSIAFALTALSSVSLSYASDIELHRVAIYANQDTCKTTEIVSIQESTQRIALSCSSAGIVNIISIQDPTAPKSIHHFSVTPKEEISSVAFHPSENVVAVAVINNDPFATGTVQFHDADTGQLLNTLASGVHPDGLAFSPNGKFLVIANEGEAYRYNDKKYESPEGSITLINYDNVSEATATQIPLSDYSNIEGMVEKKYARKLERIIIGGNSKEEIEVPLRDNTPMNTEPEFVTFSPDSAKAYISLQENNGVLIIDTATAKIEKVFGLGITEHVADTKYNNKVKFSNKLRALREPDGIAISPDGKYLLTADEGDTDPKVSKILGRKPAGGGRTLSVFDAKTGAFISDTACQLDEMAHSVGLYPDNRSEKKGSEPENVISFEIQGILYAAVGLERANAIALVSLADPKQPQVISVQGVDPNASSGGKFAPEGLAYYEKDGRHYVFSANEKSGTMTVMEVKTGRKRVAVN